MWFAYALQSGRDGGLYIGMASDIEERVKEHNTRVQPVDSVTRSIYIDLL